MNDRTASGVVSDWYDPVTNFAKYIMAKRFAHQGMCYSRPRFAQFQNKLQTQVYHVLSGQNWCGVICLLTAIHPAMAGRDELRENK